MNHKIGIDFTYVLEDEVTGIRKYGEGILEGLIKLNTNLEFILFVNDFMEEVFKKKFPNCKIIPVKFFFKNMKNIRYFRIVNALNMMKIFRRNKIKNEKCDIIIYPYINRYTPVIEDQLKLITIQDVIPLDEIKDKESRQYKKIKDENVKLMNKSKYLLTISEYSKKRLLEINPEFSGEITVIPNSIEKLKESNKKVAEILNTDKPYIFSINSFFKHKNQITLVKAFDKIKEKIPHKLVLVGRPELNTPISNYNNVIEYIDKNSLKDRVEVLSYISDEDRNALFYEADLFVTTSYQEGFGRTPVEAAICKVPVISTKETSLPEATMNEVFYYENATDSEELAEKILEVINNKPTKERLEEIAKKLEEEYREEKVAKRYMELLNKILDEN